MILTIPKQSLIRAVARCQGVTNKRAAQPALACIRIDAPHDASGEVVLTATDLLSSVSVALIGCQVSDAGTFAVDARDLGERLKHMPGESVKLAYAEGKVTVSAPGTPRRFVLPALPGADFPQVKTSTDATGTTMAAADLARAIDAVVYAVSLDETRPQINAMLLEIGADRMVTVATDGHRMSMHENTNINGPATAALVPLRALHEIRKMCGDGDLDLTVADGSLFVATADATFSTRLADATFPPYSQIIPARNAKRQVIAPRAAVISAIEAVQVAAKGTTTGIMRAELAKGSIGFRAESHTGGDATDDVPADCSIALTLGVNGKYITDVLGVVDGDDASIEFGGDKDPIRIDATGLVAVVMPARLT